MKDQKKASKQQGRKISRRNFLGSAVVTAAAFTIVPRHVLGGNGYTPPSEKLNIAGIGVGGQGVYDIGQVSSENIVALCDVDWEHAADTFNRFPMAKKYRDFRKMLEKQKDIDAVVVATPDHTHAVISMMAIKMDKHVYCEKPLTHSIYEARKVTEAARERGVATQMGNQGQASEATRLICEFIWDGAIGPVREVHAWIDRPLRGLFNVFWPQGIERPKETPPVPSTLDWNLWLGPAPWRPYHPCYLPVKWRGWWDFGTGALGDIGCHTFDPIFRALKLGYPTSVDATSTLVNEETYPLASIVRYQFPARAGLPPVKLTWYDGGLKPTRPDELEHGRPMGPGGILFIGDKGKMMCGGDARGPRLIPETKMKEYKKPPKILPRSIGHYKEWVEACKGGKSGGSNFEFAGPLTEVVLMGNIALRKELKEELTRKKLIWDGPNMKVTNLPAANVYIHHQYRQGWIL